MTSEPEWRDHRLSEVKCPFCDAILDGASGLVEEAPAPGDISVCIKCAQPLTFLEDMSVRPLSTKEFRELEPELKAQLRGFMRAVRMVDRRR